MPDRGIGNLIGCLKDITSHPRFETDLSEEYLLAANEVIRSLTPRCHTDERFTLRDFCMAISTFDPTKSSGFPGNLFAPLKGDFLRNDTNLDYLIQAVCVRLLSLELLAPYCETPMEFYQVYATDCIGASIKDEPVKTEKFGRLLTGPGIVTICIETMLYHQLSTVQKRHVFEGYSGIGVGFDSLDSLMLNKKHEGVKMTSDVPYFDSTMSEFEGLLNVGIAADCANFSPYKRKIATQLERGYFRKLFVLNDNVFEHIHRCHQCTGRERTSDFNTMTRSRRAYAAAILATVVDEDFPLPALFAVTSAGDDCVETPLRATRAAYYQLGFPLRDVEFSEELSFCSHSWPVGEMPYGQRLYKACYALFQKEITIGRLYGFQHTFSGHPDYDQLKSIILEHRPEMYKMFKDLDHYSGMLVDASWLDQFQYDKCGSKKNGKKKNPVKKRAPVNGPKTKAQHEATGLATVKPPKPVRSHSVRGGNAHKQTCALVDPFCDHAKAARMPDGLGSGTVTYQVRGFTSFATLAHGGRLFYYGGQLPYGLLLADTYAAGSYTCNASQQLLPGSTTFSTYASKYRIVSWGVIIRNSAPALSASGSLIITKLASMPSPGAVVPEGQILGSEVEVHNLNASTVVAMIGKPAGSGYKVFQAPNTSTTEADIWQAYKVEILGAATDTTNKITVEIVYNVEFTLLDAQQGINQFITQSVPANPAAVQAASRVQNSTPSIFSKGVDVATKYLANQASLALTNLASEGLDMLMLAL